jgi:hypothetical protein
MQKTAYQAARARINGLSLLPLGSFTLGCFALRRFFSGFAFSSLAFCCFALGCFAFCGFFLRLLTLNSLFLSGFFLSRFPLRCFAFCGFFSRLALCGFLLSGFPLRRFPLYGLTLRSFLCCFALGCFSFNSFFLCCFSLGSLAFYRHGSPPNHDSNLNSYLNFLKKYCICETQSVRMHIFLHFLIRCCVLCAIKTVCRHPIRIFVRLKTHLGLTFRLRRDHFRRRCFFHRASPSTN